jgi:hypothetical protein
MKLSPIVLLEAANRPRFDWNGDLSSYFHPLLYIPPMKADIGQK